MVATDQQPAQLDLSGRNCRRVHPHVGLPAGNPDRQTALVLACHQELVRCEGVCRPPRGNGSQQDLVRQRHVRLRRIRRLRTSKRGCKNEKQNEEAAVAHNQVIGSGARRFSTRD